MLHWCISGTCYTAASEQGLYFAYMYVLDCSISWLSYTNSVLSFSCSLLKVDKPLQYTWWVVVWVSQELQLDVPDLLAAATAAFKIISLVAALRVYYAFANGTTVVVVVLFQRQRSIACHHHYYYEHLYLSIKYLSFKFNTNTFFDDN